MNPDLPALGVRFDIGRIGSGSYGVTCWQVFWEAVDPADLAGAVLYEGDTGASMSGHENVFCVAIQTSSPGVLGAIKAALSSHARFNEVCSPPRFIEGAVCVREPLVRAGTVAIGGEIHGDAWNARPGLAAAKRKGRSGEAISEKQFLKWDYDAVQELERLCSSLPTLTRGQAAAFFSVAAHAANCTANPVERRSDRVFEGLRGVVAASDRHGFSVTCDLTPGRVGTGVLTVETYDEVIGVFFCAVRVSDDVFLTYAFTKDGRDAIKGILSETSGAIRN